MKLLLDVWPFIRENWPFFLPVLLGFLAVYWLLPSVRRSWTLPGVVAGTLAIVLGGVFLIHREFATVEGLLFYAFSGIAVLGGGLMLAQHNPVRAALSFALVVLSTCGLFLLLGAPFLMAATIIIYGGAIIITFLFVIMLAQQAGLGDADRRSREPFLASLAGFTLLACLLIVLRTNYDTRSIDALLKDPIRDRPALQKIQRVIDAMTVVQITAILGDPNKEKTLPLLEELKAEVSVALKEEAMNMELEWAKLASPYESVRLTAMSKLQEQSKKLLDFVQTKLLAELPQRRFATGSLQPGSGLPMSKYSGVPANGLFPSEARERLPAGNVAALGTSLFTDYLVAVEMAGVLLLVATIGAIIIAGRREEELR